MPVASKLDGKTGGPRGFLGDIGKRLEGCEKLSVVKFERIPYDLPSVNRDDISTNQKYLYDIHQSVSKGKCFADLALRNPGKMAHSQSLTTANHKYVATEFPSEIMKVIVNYIMKVYAPMWFMIKNDSSSKYGAIHLFKTIELSRSMSADVRDIVFPVIQRNAFYAHPENILLSMIQDERSHIRELSWRRIKKAREQCKGKSVRIFKIPPLNFEAAVYTDMIRWVDAEVTEPPITCKLSDEEIEELIKTKEMKNFDRLPCHTQAVERCVKLVTEASSSVCGTKSRDGFIVHLNS